MVVPKQITDTRCRDGSMQARQVVQSNSIAMSFQLHDNIWEQYY